MQVVRWSSLIPLPWKNGGGITHEAWRDPAAGAPYRARASIARIDSSGAFSAFTGYRRILVLLEGDGIALEFGGGERRELRRVGEMTSFDGGAPVIGRLLGGPTMDFNLIVAGAASNPYVRVERLDSVLEFPETPRGVRLTFCLSGRASVRARGAQPIELARWDLAVADGADGPLRIDGAAMVLVARI